MPTAKAKFNGYGSHPGSPQEFSRRLKRTLAKLHRLEFGGAADQFADELLSAARVGPEDIFWHKFDVSKSEAYAELRKVSEVLKDASSKLRTLSPMVENFLDAEADPLGCAEKIEEMLGFISAVNPEEFPKGLRHAQVQHSALVEMAARVLNILENYDVSTATRVNSLPGAPSLVITILEAIGADIRLVRAETTWRDIITEANTTRIQSQPPKK
ncbi:hypothetical protein [Pseudomonas frederiksbergensis]|uniref:hypothetical protein n=1 Tax=Pseudomonas frederiksbergensis TaxID=104087 RepID=UPI000F47B170|nr:hypothetical protein [Pseudomonas frederiksbergensis]RON42950.1 hypothetical protein BK667_30575 [Pseudomonas frederiksbergensis]